MKKISYILFTFVAILIGCDNDFEMGDQDLNVDYLPGKYVAFTAPGANTTIDDVTDSEGNTVELNIEIPNGTLSNVTVNFTFSGTAIFGTDYTVTNATSNGGSVVIIPEPGDDTANLIDNADITVQLLTDGIVDGNKTLQVTLESASNDEGEVLVGRAGSDLLKTATVIIEDVD